MSKIDELKNAANEKKQADEQMSQGLQKIPETIRAGFAAYLEVKTDDLVIRNKNQEGNCLLFELEVTPLKQGLRFEIYVRPDHYDLTFWDARAGDNDHGGRCKEVREGDAQSFTELYEEMFAYLHKMQTR